MPTGTELIALAGTVATGFVYFAFNRGAKLKDDKRQAVAFLWYAVGLIPFAGIGLVWASMGGQLVTPQRIILFVVGAAIGGLLLMALGELLRPSPQAPAPIAAVSAIRTAFSSTQTISVLPPSLGGNSLLRLDNIATLRLSAPYSASLVTLSLDAAPIIFPDVKNPAIQVEDLKISLGSLRQYTFNVTDKKRQEIVVAGRAFIVTLLEVRKIPKPEMPNALEYVFGISEK
jgi:hypothetical protein